LGFVLLYLEETAVGGEKSMAFFAAPSRHAPYTNLKLKCSIFSVYFPSIYVVLLVNTQSIDIRRPPCYTKNILENLVCILTRD
jgi:hypothetical protein